MEKSGLIDDVQKKEGSVRSLNVSLNNHWNPLDESRIYHKTPLIGSFHGCSMSGSRF